MTRPTPARSMARVVLTVCAGALLLDAESIAQATKGDLVASDSPVREAVVDEFHPNKGDGKAPLYGGRIIVHLPSLPKHTNYATENSGYTRNFLYEVHETLLLQDWWTTEYVPAAAEEVTTEDLVVLAPDAPGVPGEIQAEVVRRDGGDGRRVVRAVYGQVAGDGALTVTPLAKGNPLTEPIQLPAASVERVERSSVFTFSIREGMRWQTSQVFEGDALAKTAGQTLDAEDVRFSWEIYLNPGVDCDEKRFQFEKFTRCEVVDPLTVRFFCEKQDAFAYSQLGNTLTLHPRHVYDLSDPDNPGHDPDATAAQQAEHINDNPHNKLWVGLGPYQIVAYEQDRVEAVRFVDEKGAPAYWDQERAGYVDTIRWRHISNDEQAMLALLNEELDFFNRVKSEDYFDGRTLSEDFGERFYKGHYFTCYYNYTCWNQYRPQLADPAVRRAIAHAFDSDGYLTNQYKGLGHVVSGPIPFISPFYNHGVERLEYDPDLALEILEDAGWYDRDGDDIADKGGVPLKIEFLYPGGNDASKLLGRTLQDSVRDLGIDVSLETMEWATFLERMKNRDFDAVSLAWIPELESDPEQLWHSKWGARDKKSSNNSGMCDPEIDALIEAIQAETDRAKRGELWGEFHAKIYERQPYLFGHTVPRKFAANLAVRGLKHTPIDPGYVLRDWYYVDPSVPGTRATLTGMGDPK
ncbi:MAG: ABC transporter substrate-binding protein [Planctomycetota bacterium]